MIEEAWLEYERRESSGSSKDTKSAPLCKLAGSLPVIGFTEKAERILQRALDFESGKNEEIDLSVLDIIDVLALIYENQEKWEEAEAMYIRGVKGSSSRFGVFGSETLQSKRGLANCLRKQGKYIDACKMHQELLGTREEVLGEEHSDTLQNAHDLAVSLYFLEEYVEAESLLRRAIEGRQKNLGPENSETLDSTCELARVMEALGRFDEAISLYEQAGNGYEKTLGPGSHWTKSCREAVQRLGSEHKSSICQMLYN